MFGFKRFKNEEYTLYLRLFSLYVRHCIKRVFGFARFKIEGGHCICVCLVLHACMDIVFSMCLGSLALRTKNILWICVCLGSRACRLYGHCI